MTASHTSSTMGFMSTIELPEDVAAALAAAAAERGVSIPELLAEFVAVNGSDELDSFIGIGASGQTEPFDIHAERKAVAAERDIATI